MKSLRNRSLEEVCSWNTDLCIDIGLKLMLVLLKLKYRASDGG